MPSRPEKCPRSEKGCRYSFQGGELCVFDQLRLVGLTGSCLELLKLSFPCTQIILGFYCAVLLFGINSILRVLSIASASLFKRLMLGFLVPFSNRLISA